jgi:Gp37 protein
MSVLDSPWGGETFSPATALDIASIEAAIVAQLAAAIGNIVEVTHFPDRPEAYEMRHRIGVVMVIYNGSEYGKVLDIGNVAQERTLEFSFGIRIRDLGWAFGGPPSGTSPGAYQVLEGIRVALTGFQPNTGCTKMRPVRERFLDRDRQGGVWVYEMIFATRTVAVESYQAPPFPLFTIGTAQEEGGVTVINAGMALLSFSGSPGAIVLGHGNVSAVAVESADLSISYSAGTDYSVDTVNGIIDRIASGAIPSNAIVAVSYRYSEITTALASGGSVPFAPSN